MLTRLSARDAARAAKSGIATTLPSSRVLQTAKPDVMTVTSMMLSVPVRILYCCHGTADFACVIVTTSMLLMMAFSVADAFSFVQFQLRDSYESIAYE